jgi:hypothetical protein
MMVLMIYSRHIMLLEQWNPGGFDELNMQTGQKQWSGCRILVQEAFGRQSSEDPAADQRTTLRSMSENQIVRVGIAEQLVSSWFNNAV